MAVKLRMTRAGRTHRSFFRIHASDSRNPRDGAFLEELGIYDPANRNEDQQVRLNAERVQYWLSVGAQPSHTVASILKRQGIKTR